MFERSVRDETGMTMGLALMMVVLIGVMGAGLLAFIQRDLAAVVEVNKGQKAFELADAGAQLAGQQIQHDAEPEHYDVDDNSNGISYDPNCNDPGGDSSASARTPSSEDWSPKAGVTRTVADGSFKVTIQWLNRSASAPDGCRAPVATGVKPIEARYFEVISTGEFGGSKRKVEAIFSTYDTGMPRAYFSQADIMVDANSCISNVSLFALNGISLGGNGCTSGGQIQGQDLAYGNWQNDFNLTARATADAGFGTPGSITGEVAGRDYDGGASPKFVRDVPESGQSFSQITFPFDYEAQSGQAGEDRLAFYEAEALLQESSGQDHYVELGSSGQQKLTTWPKDSDYDTVVYVKFPGASPGALRWSVPGTCADSKDTRRGILVVDNGSLELAQNTAALSGYVLIRGGDAGTYKDAGANSCFNGYVNASGAISINGSPKPGAELDLANSPGFYGIHLWSWRELYQ